MRKWILGAVLGTFMLPAAARADVGWVNCETPQSWLEHSLGKLGNVFSFGLSVEGEEKTKFGVSGHASPAEGLGFALDTPIGRIQARVNPAGALVFAGALICLGDTSAE